MPKLTDDPKVAEAIEKAEARGANAERKRINALIGAANTAAGELEDKGATKAVKAAFKQLKTDIKDGVTA